ncbi:hypothetical protein [Oleisolibacter albus]|uniref:hypothetical protein n=1 Tax=Oleisolibacter albus TaxID=2171757 RepID=UPI0012D74A3F|nr:hypothetical protein [Oleisolibacter albus]
MSDGTDTVDTGEAAALPAPPPSLPPPPPPKDPLVALAELLLILSPVWTAALERMALFHPGGPVQPPAAGPQSAQARAMVELFNLAVLLERATARRPPRIGPRRLKRPADPAATRMKMMALGNQIQALLPAQAAPAPRKS